MVINRERAGIDDAVDIAGSQSELARLVGVSRQAVQEWVTKGWVPNDRVERVEELTQVPRERLVDPSLRRLVTGDE
jgi:DNA-binding transcriptional regulator YdaS (Cro superfamily)